jgi:hypothetical protein
MVAYQTRMLARGARPEADAATRCTDHEKMCMGRSAQTRGGGGEAHRRRGAPVRVRRMRMVSVLSCYPNKKLSWS